MYIFQLSSLQTLQNYIPGKEDSVAQKKLHLQFQVQKMFDV